MTPLHSVFRLRGDAASLPQGAQGRSRDVTQLTESRDIKHLRALAAFVKYVYGGGI